MSRELISIAIVSYCIVLIISDLACRNGYSKKDINAFDLGVVSSYIVFAIVYLSYRFIKWF